MKKKKSLSDCDCKSASYWFGVGAGSCLNGLEVDFKGCNQQLMDGMY